MAEAPITLAFHGPAVDGGQMDARRVGETLLGLSELVAEVKSTDPSLRQADGPRVRVTGFGSDSFDIYVVLEGLGDVWEQYRDVTAGKSVTAIANTAALIAILVNLLKRFGLRRVTGQRPDGDDQVVVDFDDDGEVRRATMSTEAFVAFMSPRVRKASRRMVGAVQGEGIASLTVSSGGESAEVRAKDVPSFEVEDPTPPEAKTTRREARVQPVSVNFARESWRVSEGANTFAVKVEDEVFLRALDTGDADAAIGKTDIFEVALRTDQTVDDQGRLKIATAIERVIRHERGETQAAFDLTAGEADS